MKRFAATLLGAALLAGCGGGGSDETASSTTSSTTQPVVQLDDSERFAIARVCVAADLIMEGEGLGVTPAAGSVDEILDNAYPVENLGDIGQAVEDLRAARTSTETVDAVRTVKRWCDQP